MAEAAGILSTSDKNFIKTVKEFELGLKEKLVWSKKEWKSSGESGTRINRLCNSVNYWKKKLRPAIEDTSVIITLFNPNCDVRTNLFHIIEAIEKLDTNIRVVGFADFRNPRYVCIYLRSVEERDKVKENFRMFENNYVVYMSWALEGGENVTSLKVHWLPMTLDIAVIEKELNDYVKCLEYERKIITSMSGRNLSSGKVLFKVTVNKAVKIEEIPHVMLINNMEALITVRGRSPLCLNCDKLGHVSKECRFRFCGECNSLELKEHECRPDDTHKLYSAKVKQNIAARPPDDWGDAIQLKKPLPQDDTHLSLANEITKLEKQIVILKNESLDLSQAKKENKRKVITGEEKFEGAAGGGQEVPDDQDDLIPDDSSIEDENSEQIGSKMDFTAGSANTLVMDNAKMDEETIKIKKQKKSNNSLKVNETKIKLEATKETMVTRSYGRPILNNPRRIKQEKDHEKALQKREFIFND